MALYTKKAGQFVPLTKQQIRQMQRQEHVLELQRASVVASNTLLALAAWLDHLEKRGNKMGPKDFVIAAAPNRVRLVGQVKTMMAAIKTLQTGGRPDA